MGTSATRSSGAAARRGRLDRHPRPVVEAVRDRRGAAEHRGAHVGNRLGAEALEVQHRAQHAQHLPPWPRVALRLHDALELLHAPLAVDERAGGLGERRDRQQDVRVRLAVRIRAHHDDEVRLFERTARGHGIGEVELGFGVQQHVRLARIREHRVHVHAAGLRMRARDMRADGVRGLAEEAERGAGRLRQQLRQRVDLRGVEMLHRIISEQDRGLLAGREALGDCALLVGRRNFREDVGHGGTARERRRHDNARERRGNARRRDDRLVRDPDQPVVVDRMQHRHLRALLRRLAQPLREQGMVLAQEAADHQHAVERRNVGDRHAQPRNALGVAVAAEVLLAQPEVDVVATQSAHEAAGQRQLLERRVRRREDRERTRAMARDDVHHAARNDVEGGLPVHFLPFARLLDHRRRQPLR